MALPRSLLSILLTGALATSCGDAAKSTPPSSEPSSAVAPAPTRLSRTPAPTPTLPPEVLAVIPFEDEIYGVEAYRDVVWIEGTEGGDPKVIRLDARTGEVQASVPGTFPQILGDDLWVVDGDDQVRMDPLTGEERQRLRLPHGGIWVMFDGDFFIASEAAHQITRWNPRTGKTKATIPLPPGEPKAAVAFAGSLWIPIDGADVLVRVDPATNKASSIALGPRPHSVAIGFGSIWITCHGTTEVDRVDPATSEVVPIGGAGRNVAITVTERDVWAATPSGIARIDPTTNEIAQRIELGAADFYAADVADASLWLSAVDRHVVYRLALP